MSLFSQQVILSACYVAGTGNSLFAPIHMGPVYIRVSTAKKVLALLESYSHYNSMHRMHLNNFKIITITIQFFISHIISHVKYNS